MVAGIERSFCKWRFSMQGNPGSVHLVWHWCRLETMKELKWFLQDGKSTSFFNVAAEVSWKLEEAPER